MHIAACQLMIDGRPRQSGEEVPEFVRWSAAVQAHHIRQGSVVFVPPQIIPLATPAQAEPEARTEAPRRKGRS